MKLRPNAQRKGTVVVAVAISLVALFGILALSVDSGLLMDKRRQVHCTADAAALAAASDMYARWWTNKGLDPGGTARASALATAAANGYTNGVDGCTITVNIPPLSGPFINMAGHAEVIINHVQPRYFSRVFGTQGVVYGARAVSRGRRSAIDNAIIVLAPGGKGSLNAGGNGAISVTGSAIQVNSSDISAMIANGNGTMTADRFLVAGSPGYTTPGGGSFAGPIVPNSKPIPDPLAYLPVPDPSTMTVESTNKTQISGNRTVKLKPGVYKDGISITGGTVNLDPGIYYMDGGGFSLSGQANLYGTGVMIYNAPKSNSDTISLSGGGNCSLWPMLTGPYQGVLLFQDRTSTAPVSVSGSSGASLTLNGTFYCASATLNVTGNGTQQTIGSQYISYNLVLGGNGSYTCNWTPNLTPGTREILLVE